MIGKNLKLNHSKYFQIEKESKYNYVHEKDIFQTIIKLLKD